MTIQTKLGAGQRGRVATVAPGGQASIPRGMQIHERSVVDGAGREQIKNESDLIHTTRWKSPSGLVKDAVS